MSIKSMLITFFVAAICLGATNAAVGIYTVNKGVHYKSVIFSYSLIDLYWSVSITIIGLILWEDCSISHDWTGE